MALSQFVLLDTELRNSQTVQVRFGLITGQTLDETHMTVSGRASEGLDSFPNKFQSGISVMDSA